MDNIEATIENPEKCRSAYLTVKGMRIGFKIDSIFHSNHFKALSSRIVSRGTSDHELVLSSPTLKESEAHVNHTDIDP